MNAAGAGAADGRHARADSVLAAARGFDDSHRAPGIRSGQGDVQLIFSLGCRTLRFLRVRVFPSPLVWSFCEPLISCAKGG